MDETEVQTPNQTALRRPVRQIQVEEEKWERISKTMAAMLIIVAACIDAFEAILDILLIGEFVSPVISVCADFLFFIWFKMLGVSFTKDPENLAAMATQAMIGLVPGLDILPELTLGVIGIVIFTRMVDKSNILAKAAGVAQTKIKS
jgi:hypothetical protein